MKKLATLAAGAVMLIAGSASAATISDPLFSNGDTTIDAVGNSTVTGTFTLQVGANEVCEVLRTQAAPQAFTDNNVGGPLGDQQGTYTNVPFSVKVSPNTGTYYPTIQCAGIWGGNHSVDGADNVVATANLGTIRVTANGSGSVGGGSSSCMWGVCSLTDLVAALKLALGGGTTTTTKPAFCASMPNVNSWSSTGQVQVLQDWMVSNHFMSQSAVNTGYGIYGPKTTKAHFDAQNACE